MADKDWRVQWEFVEGSSGRINDTTVCIRDHTSAPLADALSGDTLASDISSWTATLARAMCYPDFSLARIHVNRGGPFGPGEGDDPEAGEATVNAAGTLATGSGTILPHALCMRVTLRTALASRRGRGRFHAPWPGVGGYKSSTNADTWNVGGAYWNAVVAFANALAAGHDVTHDLIDHHLSLRVHSRVDATTRDVTSVVPRTEVSYLRSRLSAP